MSPHVFFIILAVDENELSNLKFYVLQYMGTHKNTLEKCADLYDVSIASDEQLQTVHHYRYFPARFKRVKHNLNITVDGFKLCDS
jgi:hypothetical protein